MYDTYNTDWRFAVTPSGEIYRGRAELVGGDDTARYYFDYDDAVVFFDGYYRHGLHGMYGEPGNSEGVQRAMTAYDKSGKDHTALTRVAQRITGNKNADFVCVNLDRGYDAFVLMWDASDETSVRDFRDEIEAVFNGEEYRINVESWDGEKWNPESDVCETYYGDRQIEAGLETEFPETECPAEVHVS